MKALLLFFALVPSWLLADPAGHVLSPVESDPHLISGLEFSVVTQSEWPYPSNKSSQETVVLQLRITNRTKSAMLFPTFDSFMVGLKTSGGEVLRLGGGRDATRITPNILLQPEAGFSIQIKTTLRPLEENKGLGLIVEDGTGSITTAALQAGDYLIFFDVFPTQYDFEKGSQLSAPLWKGKGTTKSIGFRVSSHSEGIQGNG